MKDKKRFVCANAFYEGREYYYCLKKIPSYNWTMLFLVSADHVATKAIRSSGHPMAETIPIIAMTANAFVEDIHDALDAGMNAHVAKPVDMQVLKETVAQVIGGRA